MENQLLDNTTKTHKPWSRWHERLHNQLKLNPDLLPTNCSLLIALSGGQDSMALISLLLDLRRLHHWQLNVWHGDHQWHKQSTKFASELKTWCEERNLNFYSDQASLEETKTESLARDWRYSKLTITANSLVKENQGHACFHVLTGHTGSDRAETLLLNLARGTNLAGLGSMKISRPLGKNQENRKIKLIRPMLCFNREETLQICSEKKLPIWIDPSNQNLNISRNRVRHKVLPILEELHPGCSLRIASLAERISHQNRDQKEIASLAIANLKHPKGLSRAGLIQLPQTARATILSFWLQQSEALNISSAELKKLSEILGPQQPPGKRNLIKGWTILWNRESIQLENNNIKVKESS